jgi:hypothetical protein
MYVYPVFRKSVYGELVVRENKLMKMTRWLSGAAIAVLGLTGSATSGFAAAGDECVKILGYE